MAKFAFEDSRYFNLWANQDILSTYIDTTPLLRTNFGFCWTQFDIDGNVTPANPTGVASFTVQSVTRKASPMASIRQPLGGSKQLDLEGLSAYSGSIPNLIAHSIHENAFERADKEKRFQQYGRDKELIMQWTQKVQSQMDSLNQSYSNMAAQLLSTGKIDYAYGMGGAYAQDANLPKANIVKAGTKSSDKAWTDPSCQLLDQMAALEEKFRTDNGLENVAMKWQIPYAMFHNVFLKNAQVKKLVVDYRTNNLMATTEGFVITEAIFREVVNVAYPQISPIEVVVEKQKDIAKGDVNGWNSKVAVFRPAGMAGVVKHTDSLDIFMDKYGATDIVKTFAQVGPAGLFILANTVVNDGEYKGWHTDMFSDGVPTLNEVPFHFIVDTSKAGNGVTTLDE